MCECNCISLHLFMATEFIYVSPLTHCNHFAFSASKRFHDCYFFTTLTHSHPFLFIFIFIYSSFSCSDLYFVFFLSAFFHHLYNHRFILLSVCASRLYSLIYLSAYSSTTSNLARSSCFIPHYPPHALSFSPFFFLRYLFIYRHTLANISFWRRFE